MARLLLVYGTHEGQTQKIARFMRDEFTQRGVGVDLFNASEIPREIRPDNYDAVIAGGSVNMWKFPRALRRWVAKNAASLSSRPSAFFSVCLAVLSKHDEKAQAATRKISSDFFKKAGWSPSTSAIFAGALMYTKYGWFTRWMMKAIAYQAGQSTDTRQDYEYTDWNEVRGFVERFATRYFKTQAPKESTPLLPNKRPDLRPAPKNLIETPQPRA